MSTDLTRRKYINISKEIWTMNYMYGIYPTRFDVNIHKSFNYIKKFHRFNVYWYRSILTSYHDVRAWQLRLGLFISLKFVKSQNHPSLYIIYWYRSILTSYCDGRAWQLVLPMSISLSSYVCQGMWFYLILEFLKQT